MEFAAPTMSLPPPLPFAPLFPVKKKVASADNQTGVPSGEVNVQNVPFDKEMYYIKNSYTSCIAFSSGEGKARNDKLASKKAIPPIFEKSSRVLGKKNVMATSSGEDSLLDVILGKTNLDNDKDFLDNHGVSSSNEEKSSTVLPRGENTSQEKVFGQYQGLSEGPNCSLFRRREEVKSSFGQEERHGNLLRGG